MKYLYKYAGEMAMLEADAGYGDRDAKALLEENMKMQFQDEMNIVSAILDEIQEKSEKQFEPDSDTGIWQTNVDDQVRFINEKRSLIELSCKRLNRQLPALLAVMQKECAESNRELGSTLIRLRDRGIQTFMFGDFDGKLEDAYFEFGKLAIPFYQVAAEQGDKGAQYDLGVLFLEGENYGEAEHWLSMASRNGRKTHGNSLKRKLIPFAKLGLGKEYYNNGKNTQAIECLEECIREGINTDTWVVEAKQLLGEIGNGIAK